MDEIIEDMQSQIDGHAETISELKNSLAALAGEYYKNNFISSQDFQKASNFNTSLKIPVLASLPATCTIGQVCSSGGKLYHCSAANTWTSQT